MKNLLAPLLIALVFSFAAAAQPKRAFEVKGAQFLLDGRPFQIRSGEMHYPRVPRAYWRERLRNAKALGLNAITTYVFWNLHEKEPGVFDFKDNLDVAEFVRIAGEEGLFVIVRPGPYVCTEWDFGGIPAWLVRDPATRVRTKDPRFLAASERYMKKVGAELAPLQITRGGNVILVQVENEYGSFGADREYLEAVRRSVAAAGFDVPLFTSDGPAEKNVAAGALPGLAAVINFSANDDIKKQFETFARSRADGPRMVGEYWIGWFDHWGEKRHTVPAETVARGVDYLMKNDISFNLYMFHGGTTFGWMAGANYSRRSPYEPDTSAYDYDSPLDEAGRPTAKYFAIQDVLKKYLPPSEFAAPVAATPTIAVPAFRLDEAAPLDALLKNPVKNARPLGMDDLGQNHGLMLYRRRIDADFRGTLAFEHVNDYANVFVDRKPAGALYRGRGEKSLAVDLEKGATLDVLVENMGRINFGADFILDRKGIFGRAALGDAELAGWEMFRLPLDDLGKLKFARGDAPGAVFFRGRFALGAVGGTFFDLRGWGKGHVWVNGRHLGRFWRIGPQQTLFCPAAWLKKGANEIVVLDVENPGRREISGAADPIYGN